MPRIVSDKYEILGKLGQGGMGTVYKARHTLLDSIVALKMLPEQLVGDPEFVARFQREARVMAQLRHEHIVRVFDIIREEGAYYLVEEFIEGENLAEFLRARGAFPPADAIDVGTQIAQALAFAHERGVIHRDVKPSNVLLEQQPVRRALLTDFGIAKVSDAAEHTRTGTMLGSLKYSAPEQLGHKIDGVRVGVDARADVYSFGLLLFEMLEGTAFFAGLESSEVLGRVLYDPAPLELHFTRPVPEALQQLLARAIARNPADRQQTMQEVLAELAAVGRPRVEARPPRAAAPVAPAAPPALKKERPRPQPVAALRSRTPALGVTAVALVAVATGGWLWWQHALAPTPIARVEPPPAVPPVPPPTSPVPPLAWDASEPQVTALTGRAGEPLEFSARLAATDRHPEARIVWQLDGDERATGDSFAFTPGDGDQGQQRTVTAVASDGSEHVERRWVVAIETAAPPTTAPRPAEAPVASAPEATRSGGAEPTVEPPKGPRVGAVQPKARQLRVAAGEGKRFSAEIGDGATGEWTLDRRVVARGTISLDLPDDLAPGAHSVEVTAVASNGLRSAPTRWTVEVLSPSAPNTTLPEAAAAATERRVTGADAEAWIERARAAWARKDAAALRALGLDVTREDLAGKTEVGDASVLIDSGGGARVWIEKRELDDNNQIVSREQRTLRLHWGSDGVVAQH